MNCVGLYDSQESETYKCDKSILKKKYLEY